MFKKIASLGFLTCLALSTFILLPSAVSATAPYGCYQLLNASPSSSGGYEQLTNDTCSGGNNRTNPSGSIPDPTKNCYVEDSSNSTLWTITSCDNIQQVGIVNGGAVSNGKIVAPAACGDGKTSCTSTLPTDCGGSNQSACEINGNKIITDVINPAIKIFSIVVGVVAVIMLIIAGIIYSASQDDPKRITLAKKIIIDVVIGIVVYVFLFAILNFLLPQGVKGG